MAYEQPVDRIPTIPGGRDEVNAMGESVNTMADHKAQFLAWWKSSLREADALEESRATPQPSADAARQLERARSEKRELSDKLHREIRDEVKQIAAHAARLEGTNPHGKRLEETLEIERSAKSVLATLDVLLGPAPDAARE